VRAAIDWSYELLVHGAVAGVRVARPARQWVQA